MNVWSMKENTKEKYNKRQAFLEQKRAFKWKEFSKFALNILIFYVESVCFTCIYAFIYGGGMELFMHIKSNVDTTINK